MIADVDPEEMTIEEARRMIVECFNLIEAVKQENQSLRAEIERLRAEIRRLKGEPVPPRFGKKNASTNGSGPDASSETSSNASAGDASGGTDISSEEERHEPKPWSKSGKKETLRIDRTVTVSVDPAILPPDAVFKGYEEVIIQDLIVRTDTVLFRKQKYYSPSTGRTYLAELPPGYEGGFGPEMKALAISMSFGSNVSEAKIREFFGQAGVTISSGGVSNLLIRGQEGFHEEKSEVFAAGLRSSPWQHLDETGTSVKGVGFSCHVVCNPLYTAYFTLPSKGRPSVIEALRGGKAPLYVLNAEAYDRLEAAHLPKRVLRGVETLPWGEFLTADALLARLSTALPNAGPLQRTKIVDALGLASYHTEEGRPRLLLCDDAPQFKELTEELGLCWIHEGRHYKKLQPYLPRHQRQLADFLKEFWDYYRDLGDYRNHPSEGEKVRLSEQFDELFGTVTGYEPLDARIALTRAKKTELLAVLDHPEIPLHNNPAELGARRRVRKRDVSFGPQTQEGTRAWDTFMTLAATSAQLGISFYDYLKDRITRAGRIPPLATLIDERAQTLNLGASWVT